MTERITAIEFRGLAAGKSAKPSKYRNRKTKVDGITFDSAKEARRYAALKILEKAGEIRNLRLQVSYRLEVSGLHVCDYVADFVYETPVMSDRAKGSWPRLKTAAIEYRAAVWRDVVEDAKGFRTPEYKIKAKLMKACLGITILET